MSPQVMDERRPDETSKPWWKHHGFTENPFALREAGQELRLSEYFVHGQDYDAVKGSPGAHQTTIVFAARGCGKSAYRRMIQASCRPAGDEIPILAVAHTKFSSVLGASSALADVTLEAHVEALLRSAAITLLQEFLRRPASFDHLPLDDRNLFSWFVHTYAPRTLRPLYLIEELAAVDEFDIEAHEVREITPSLKQFIEWLERPPMNGNPQARLLLTLLRAKPTPPTENAMRDPVTLVREFVDLARQSGLRAVYFLVDGLDELRLTATDPAAAADLVIPLLAELSLMELEHTAFKFFLPAETTAALRVRRDSRLDRFPIYHLTWRDADLGQMLQLRLMAFNESGVDSLGAISEPDISRRIDADLVEMAYGSPRRLLMLGDALFAAHAARLGAGLLLNQQDWEDACRNFERIFGPLVPPLRVDQEMSKVFIGGDECPSRLSPTEFKLLEFLYGAGGRLCTRDEISYALLERPEYGVISDEAFDSLVSRLRRKIERYPRRPVYLITERGMGYRLENIG